MTRISRSPDPGWANRLRAQARLEAQDLEDLKLTSLLRMRAMYDTLHMYAEAYAVSAGVRFIGDGAHYELIEYLREENMITEAERDFLQRLREKRNELLYEGKQPTLTFVKEIVEKFSKLAEKIAEAQPRKQ